MKWRVCITASWLLIAVSVRADEIRLKDGSKIIGTIVGYEEDAFKVQTSYGFAMIRKDSIAEIIPSEAKKPAEAPAPLLPAGSKPQIEQNAEKSPRAQKAPKAVAESKGPVAPTSSGPSPAQMPRPAASSTPAVPINEALTPPVSVTAQPASSVPVGPAVLAVPAAPKPEPIRETIRGNVYVNETFGFQMFRPPGWDLIADAGKALPDAITALGSSDETTLFVVGHDALSDSLDAHAAATERKLRSLYENYRPISTQHATVGGFPAIETRFRGTLGDHDWSVTVATLARNKEAFTFLAMTYASSDLIQIQENVIAKTIGSLQFTAPN